MREEEQSRLIQRGREADRLLNDPTLTEAFEEAFAAAFGEFIATEADEGHERDAIWATAQALKLFKDLLARYVSVGKLEEANRNEDRKLSS